MAIFRKNIYPTQTLANVAGYRGGKAKNKSSVNDTTGTPFEAQWLNDLWGFLDALLGRGARIRSEVPDTSLASDHCMALEEIIRYWVMQAFNPLPISSTGQANQGKFRASIPLYGYNRSYWRPTTADGRNARLYLYHHAVAVNGSEEDFIRQMIPFPIPRLKMTGIYATFENAGDMQIRIDKRRRNEQPNVAFTSNVLVLRCDDYPSSSQVEAYVPVSGTIEQNPDLADQWEYVLTIEGSSTTGTRLGNLAVEYQWMPLDSSYDTLLDMRATSASQGTVAWG